MGRQHDVPRLQRFVEGGGLREFQRSEQGLEIAIRVDSVDLAARQQRVQVRASVGAGHGV